MKTHIKNSLKVVLMMFFILPDVKAYSEYIYDIPHYFDNAPELEILEWQADRTRKLEEINSNPYFFKRVLKYAQSDFAQALAELSWEENKRLRENNPIVARLLDEKKESSRCAYSRGLTWADKIFHSDRYEEVKKEAELCANNKAKDFFSIDLFKIERGFDYSVSHRLKKMKEAYEEAYNEVMD